MKRILASVFFVLAFTLVVGPSQRANALVSTFDVINFKPAVDSSSYLTLYDTDTHARGEWNIGFYLDWAHHPLELGAPLGTRRLGVVDDTLVANLIGSIGITNWLEAGVRVPVVAFNNYQGLSGVSQVRPESLNDFSMGDVGVDFKLGLIHSDHFGLALVPFVSVPTGRSSTFMGQGTVTGGAKIAFDVKAHDRVRLGLNAGYIAKDDVTIRGARIDDMVTLGAAITVKPHSRFDIIAEGHTETVARDFFQSKVQTPAEVDGALRFHATNNLAITAGGGAGLTLGVGSPDFRAFLGLNYTRHHEEAPPTPAPPTETISKITIDQKIHFDFDKAVIKSESYGILDDVASVLKAHANIRRVRIEGHTDSIGSDAYNMRLSQRRADAVRNYLTQKAIDPNRLESVGYGESRPIAPNTTTEGRAQNRRTEFNVTEQ